MFARKYKSLDVPFAFAGRSAAYRYNPEKSQKRVNEELFKIDTYNWMREAKRPKVFNPYYVYSKRQLMQFDLADVSRYERFNDGVTFLFCGIDFFSRKAFVRPLKSKSMGEVHAAFLDLYRETGPFKAWLSDYGTEFHNRLMRDEFDRLKIQVRYPSYKAGTVERFIRSLHSLLFRYIIDRGSQRYIDDLQKIVSLYNNRYHRVIKNTPNFADNPRNAFEVNEALAQKYDRVAGKKKKPKLKVGDRVHIIKSKGTFAKGYEAIFKRELFKVSKVFSNLPIAQYELTDRNGEIVRGRFYPEELQVSTSPKHTIQKIVRMTKSADGKMWYLVKWKGLNDLQNQWLAAEDTLNYFSEATTNE